MWVILCAKNKEPINQFSENDELMTLFQRTIHTSVPKKV